MVLVHLVRPYTARRCRLPLGRPPACGVLLPSLLRHRPRWCRRSLRRRRRQPPTAHHRELARSRWGCGAAVSRRMRGGCGSAQILPVRELKMSFVFLLSTVVCGIFTSPFIFGGACLLVFFAALLVFPPLCCIFGSTFCIRFFSLQSDPSFLGGKYVVPRVPKDVLGM